MSAIATGSSHLTLLLLAAVVVAVALMGEGRATADAFGLSRASTRLALTVGPGKVAVGQPFELAAAVTEGALGGAVNHGAVDFYDATKPFAQQLVGTGDAPRANVAITPTEAGTFTYRAVFGPATYRDRLWTPSVATLTITVTETR